MTSVFILDPNDINEESLNYNYTFLNNSYPKYKQYYSLLNKTDNYKKKNIYNFIYIRLIKMKKVFPEITLLEKRNIKSLKDFNTIIKKYISKDKIKAIIVINCISHYYVPYKFN